jgi:hypothetical protein
LWRRPADRIGPAATWIDRLPSCHELLATTRFKCSRAGGPLIDCHSMPPRQAGGSRRETCGRIGILPLSLMRHHCAPPGSRLLNDPYAGGAVVSPARQIPRGGLHAIQRKLTGCHCSAGRPHTAGLGFDRSPG